MAKSALILNYHQITFDDKNQSSPKRPPFSVKHSDFIKHIQLIIDHNIPIVSLSDWRNDNINAPLSVILTFDDGYKSDYKIVFKYLLHQQIKASFFPILSLIGTKGRTNWKELIEMADNGFTIGSHGVNHNSLLQLNEEDCIVELTESMHTIEQRINQKVDIFSLPYGMYNRRLLNILKGVGYNFALTTRVRMNVSSEAFLLHRINIKGNTSIQEFEQIITSKSGLPKKKTIVSNVSFLANNILGVSRVNSFKELF